MPYNFGFRILIQSGRDNPTKKIKMKQFIPFLSVTIASVFLQNCTNRDEEVISSNNQLKIEKTIMKREDSAKTSGEILDPDPPVRDGDNWRLAPNQ